MSDEHAHHGESGSASGDESEYVVVARRYRPQTFDELLGQEHVAKALTRAIESNRVGHAYLFTGARGVGKTSAARILAKALDCVRGPTASPCNQCDICQSVSAGDDVDVLEIDGASNRGIDEIRQVRSNVNIRPSRARFKIYIIDEVHMLTPPAFNALLKTLEEPPEHVKFIFCTTEPNKIPITVLSRCQRYDFAGIQTDAIVQRLAQIAEAEGVATDQEALQLLARRAAGSMRDSQSLLEQLLASGGEKVTVADVHEMLGTADSTQLLQIAQHLAEGHAAQALSTLDSMLSEGVDVGQLLEQMLGVFRDAMVALAGCGNEAFLSIFATDEQEKVRQIGEQLGLETTLAVVGILEQAEAGLRYTTHRRTAAEVALVRCCNLDGLEELAGLIAQLRQGTGEMPSATPLASPPPKKKSEQRSVNRTPILGVPPETTPKMDQPSPAGGPLRRHDPPVPREPTSSSGPESDSDKPAPLEQRSSLDEATAKEIWEKTLDKLTGMVTAKAKNYANVAIPAPNRLVVSFSETYNLCKSFCERPDQVAKIQEALREVTGARVQVVFSLADDKQEKAPKRPARARQKKLSTALENPMVKKARELFGARPVDID